MRCAASLHSLALQRIFLGAMLYLVFSCFSAFDEPDCSDVDFFGGGLMAKWFRVSVSEAGRVQGGQRVGLQV